MSTGFWYGKGLLHALTNVNILGGNMTLALCTASYTPNQDTDETFANITNEVTGTGYTAGGQLTTNVQATYTAGTNIVKVTFDPVTWAASTLTARIAVWYQNTGNPSTSTLIGWADNGSNLTSTAGAFVFTPDSAGFLKDTAS